MTKLRHLLVLAAIAAVAPSSIACTGASPRLESASRASEAQTPAPAPASQSVDALVAEGRAKLAAGDVLAAQALFDEAAAQDGGSLKTRTWVLRGWLAQGRVNDAYNAIDELAKTSQGPEIDYLYGMAFATDAKRAIETNQTGPMTGTKIEDAFQFLDTVVKKDAVRFSDATLMLCWSAWQLQRYDAGRAAAEKAVELGLGAQAKFEVGRFALAQHQAAGGDAALAAKHLDAARAAFADAAKLLEGKTSASERDLAARVAVDMGHVHLRSKAIDDAVASYARAMGLAPTLPNYTQLLGALGEEKFLAALEAGEKTFLATYGAQDPADATLLWWLGWARLQQKQYETAETAFAGAVKKVPAFVNSWFYVAVCRFSRQDRAGAVEAIEKHKELAPDDLTATLQQNPSFNLNMLDALVGWCASAKPARNLDAALISEAQALAKPDEVRYWNNAGFFFRDAGDALARTRDETKRKQAVELWERAYAAYLRALELTPDDPALLNDTAVMLHYNLDRDADKAKELYTKAIARAEELLAKPALKPEEKDLYTTALRDASNNLKKLEAGIKTN